MATYQKMDKAAGRKRSRRKPGTGRKRSSAEARKRSSGANPTRKRSSGRKKK